MARPKLKVEPKAPERPQSPEKGMAEGSDLRVRARFIAANDGDKLVTTMTCESGRVLRITETGLWLNDEDSITWEAFDNLAWVADSDPMMLHSLLASVFMIAARLKALDYEFPLQA